MRFGVSNLPDDYFPVQYWSQNAMIALLSSLPERLRSQGYGGEDRTSYLTVQHLMSFCRRHCEDNVD